MAPEMLLTKPHQKPVITTATDIHGLGLILWEMKTAEKPYADWTLDDVIEAISQSESSLSIPSDLSDDVKLLITQCWHREPRLRPTCDEVCTSLFN